jgi:hypothetical protein
MGGMASATKPRRFGPNTQPCINSDDHDSPEGEARTVHAWESRGLDIVDDVLCSIRRCVWCDRYQHKGYGGVRPKTWTTTR